MRKPSVGNPSVNQVEFGKAFQSLQMCQSGVCDLTILEVQLDKNVQILQMCEPAVGHGPAWGDIKVSKFAESSDVGEFVVECARHRNHGHVAYVINP